jgi:hypothetical protein
MPECMLATYLNDTWSNILKRNHSRRGATLPQVFGFNDQSGRKS